MTPERWSRLQRLFAEALRRCPVDRADWLAAETGGDRSLLEEVQALLDRDAVPDRSVERAIAAEAARVLADYGEQAPSQAPGAAIPKDGIS